MWWMGPVVALLTGDGMVSPLALLASIIDCILCGPASQRSWASSSLHNGMIQRDMVDWLTY